MRREDVDVCVIGSGAGGAVVAWRAAQRGMSTLVLERGPYFRTESMTALEREMVPRLYKDGGLQLNTSLDFFILQGACVGGSTVLSNMVLMRPEDDVLARWDGRGAELDRKRLAASFDEIEIALDAKRVPASASSRSTQLFEKGARALGFSPQRMLKALGDCRSCGNCNIGCTFGSKKSALTTFIRWAEEAGARVLPETDVTRIAQRRGKVDCIEAVDIRTKERIVIHARVVVVAAGAIGSSALLLESGVRKNVGLRLAFNAGAMVVAEFDEPLDAYDSDQMTVFLKDDGYLIEATHNPIMSAALTTPGWMGVHADLMRRSRNLAFAGAMVGSEPSGRVVMSRWFGHEETHFATTPRDMHFLRLGVKTIVRSYFAAGARRVFLPTNRLSELSSIDDLGLVDERIRTLRDIQCGSSHPQGGNGMSDDPALGVVDTQFAVHGVEGLFVCDASVFPDACEVNPMNTVMSLANYGAPAILARA